MKASEYTFPLQAIIVRKKRVMIEKLPAQITWLDIQKVAGEVVMAIRSHTGKEDRLGEISIKPNGISFKGADGTWSVTYAKT